MIARARPSARRTRLLLITVVIADAAWLYAACGIVGFFAGQNGSPLPWAAVPALVGLGVVAARCIGRYPLSRRQRLAAHGVLAGAALYVCAAVSRGAAGSGAAWLPALVAGELSVGDAAALVVALLMSALLWRHGMVLARSASLHARALVGFRLGLVMFTVAMLVEQASGRDLHAGAMLVPFFAASLAGLAASRVPDGTQLRPAWIRTVSTCIVAIVGLGLALGATASVFGRSGIDVALAAWEHLGGALAWLVATLLGAVADGLAGLIDWLEASGMVAPFGTGGQSTADEPGLRALAPPGPIADALVDVAQVVLLVLMVYALVRLLVIAYRQLPHHGIAPLPEEHEFIGDKSDPLADIATLLRRAMPGRGARAAPRPRLHGGGLAPGIAEVFELYFELLSEAVLRGHAFAAALTPSERAAGLAAALPGAPVADITRRFNAACYGNEPSDGETVAALRRALEIAAGRRAPDQSPPGRS